MKISLACAAASCAMPSAPATAIASAAAWVLIECLMLLPPLMCGSVRKRPQPQLLLPDRPEPREAVRLDDEEEDDEGAENHDFDVRDHRGGQRHAQPRRQLVQHQRQDDDEGCAQERSEDRAETADDHHEEQLERAVHVEGERFPRSEPYECPQ